MLSIWSCLKLQIIAQIVPTSALLPRTNTEMMQGVAKVVKIPCALGGFQRKGFRSDCNGKKRRMLGNHQINYFGGSRVNSSEGSAARRLVAIQWKRQHRRRRLTLACIFPGDIVGAWQKE